MHCTMIYCVERVINRKYALLMISQLTVIRYINHTAQEGHELLQHLSLCNYTQSSVSCTIVQILYEI